MEHSTFALWTKWFWIGIITAVFNPLAGLIFGIGVATEEDRKKEGIIIAVVSIVWWIALAVIAIKFRGLHIQPIQPQQ